MTEMALVEMEVIDGLDIEFHVDDGGEMVLDRCEGIDPLAASALAYELFGGWFPLLHQNGS